MGVTIRLIVRFLVPVLAVCALLVAGDKATFAAPPNDNLSAAEALSVPDASSVDSTTGTTELGEPVPSCTGSGSRTVWYKLQAPATQTLTADTLGSGIDTVLAVYSGPPNTTNFGTLTPVACASPYPSRLTFAATAGSWYYFQIAQMGATAGTVGIRLGVPPANDNFATPTVLATPSVPGTVATTNTFMASMEVGENVPGFSCTPGTPVHSIWYRWTSPNSPGHAVFDTYGSGVDTILAVYTGASFPLTEVECNDNHISASSVAAVTYNAATTFYLQVTTMCATLPCLLSPPSGDVVINMSMGSTLFVTSQADTNVADGALTLREAMHLTQGTLGRAPDAGEDSILANHGISAGAAAGDLVHIIFTCSGFGCIPPYRTITLGSALPTLANTGDVIKRDGLVTRVDGVNGNFDCFNVTGNNNRIEGLWIERCAGGSSQAGVRVSGSGNTIGGDSAGERNTFAGNYAGVWLTTPGTGNKITGNYFGIDGFGSTAANSVGVYMAGHGSTVGGLLPGEGNVLSGNTYHGIYGIGATGNTVRGNLIGTDPAGMTAVGNGLTGIWLDNSAGNVIGGDTAAARNVISGNNGPGVMISATAPSVPPTAIFEGVTNIPIPVSGAGTISDVNVKLDISYPHTGDLSISLRSPALTTVDLSSGNGGFAANYTNTTFDDEAATAITSASPPFNGTFRPEGLLSAFDGQPRNGVWTLIINNTGFDIGILNSASLDFDQGGTNNVVAGNYIGTDIGGSTALVNTGNGVKIENSGGNVVGGTNPGEGNVIANNGSDGVIVIGGAGNSIRRNSIHTNAGPGINNVNGGNLELAPPVVVATGSASGTACANCTVEVFSDNAEEGRVYQGTAVADGSGNWSYPGGVVGPKVTATATDGAGNTSEFSSASTCADGDGDVVCNSGDNCPVIANGGQEDADGDADGDVCDNCPNWANAAQTLPPWTVPANDADCDGFDATREGWTGTDPIRQCPISSAPGDEAVDAWPTDFNDSRFTNLSDVVLMGLVYNQMTGTDPAKKRFDLNATGNINLSDVVLIGPFYNKACS